MSDSKNRHLAEERSGFFNEFSLRIKLVLRLLTDARVNFFLKLLPLGSLIYVIFPDLAPGPIDDVVLMWLGTYLFVELCPPEIVQEHMEALRAPGMSNDSNTPRQVIDAVFKDKEEES